MEENKEIMDLAAADSAPETTPTPDSAKKQKSKKVKKQPTPPPEPAEDDEEQEVPKSRRIINTVVNIVLVVAIVMAAVSTYISFMSSDGSVPSFFGICLFTVESESMEDTINKGDLVIGKAFPKNAEKLHASALELRQGDIITYQTIVDGLPALNTHRILNIGDGGTYVYFETKGDNNKYPDSSTVHETALEAKYLFHLRGLGNVVEFVQKPLGFFIVVVIPVLIFFIYHLVQFFRVLFEYQNVKMLIKYEQERGRTEDLIESQIKDQKTKEEIRRAAMEAELREQLRKEMLAEMQAQKAAESAPASEAASTSDEAAEESNNSEQ